MDDQGKYWKVSRRSLELLIREKIEKHFGKKYMDIQLNIFHHGLIFSELPKWDTQRHLIAISCKFCNHVPVNPFKCDQCKEYYCIYCSKVLFLIYNLRNGNNHPDFDNIENKRFDCISCLGNDLSKLQSLNSDEIKVFSDFKVHCRNYFCDKDSKYYDMLKHLQVCHSEEYKVNSILNFIKSNKETIESNERVAVIPPLEGPENPLKTIPDFAKAFDARLMVQYPDLVTLISGKRKSDDEHQVQKRMKLNEAQGPRASTSSSTIEPFWYQPNEELDYSSVENVSSQSTSSQQSDKPDDPEKDNQPSTSTPMEVEQQPQWGSWDQYAVAAKVGTPTVDWDSVLNTEGGPSSVSKPNPYEIYEDLRSREKAIAGCPKIVTTIDDIRRDKNLTSKQKKAMIDRRKRWEKEKAENKERKQDIKRRKKRLDWLAIKSNPNQVFNLQNCIHRDRIVETIRILNQKKLRVCGIDIEKSDVETVVGTKSLPIWIGIVDHDGNQLFNDIVRYPKKAIKFGTVFHGVTFEQTRGADTWATVKRKVIAILKTQDIICVAGGVNDFISMGFDENDWEIIRPKVRDVNTYYRCVYNAPMIALKYIIFCLFGLIIQDGEHSPIVDAGFTLWSYLVDYEKFEEAHKDSINNPMYRLPYPHVDYGYNRQMSELIRRIMEVTNDWPMEIRKRPMGKPAKSFDVDNYCDGTDTLRPPFNQINLQIFEKFRRQVNQRRPR